MKKFLLTLGLLLILVGCGWLGCPGFGAAPALAQGISPPDYGYCDPYYSQCTYNNYYTVPYTDPYTQYFYYTVPDVEEYQERERREREREFERRRDWDREHGFR